MGNLWPPNLELRIQRYWGLRSFFIFASVSVAACAARTVYGPVSLEGGYSERRLDSKTAVARFSGNAYTDRRAAALFSRFRAIETCEEDGFTITRFIATEDQSVSQSHLRTSSKTRTAPTRISSTGTSDTAVNTSGGSSVISRQADASGTIYHGRQSSDSKTWVETNDYPIFDTYYFCTNTVYSLGIRPRVLSREEMKPLVKDLMGAIQVEEIQADSPNKGILEIGDIIIKINGERIETLSKFAISVNETKDREKVALSVIRDGDPRQLITQVADVTATVLAEINRVKASACSVSEIKNRPACSFSANSQQPSKP